MDMSRLLISKPLEDKERNLFHPFFRLPPELRNWIYELALPNGVVPLPPPSSAKPNASSWQRRSPLYRAIPNLLSTNRQIYKEVHPIFWSTTIFVFYHPEDRGCSQHDAEFFRWIHSIGEKNVRSIRILELRKSCRSVPSAGHSVSVNLSLLDADKAIRFDWDEDDISWPLLVRDFRAQLDLSRLRDITPKIARVNRMPIVTSEVLWDIWDSCYNLFDKEEGKRRSWKDFRQAYELNQQQKRPRAWTEEVWRDMHRMLQQGETTWSRPLSRAELAFAMQLHS